MLLFYISLSLIVIGFISFLLGYWKGRIKRDDFWKKQVKNRLDTSRAVLKGQIGEQIVPLLGNFPYLLSELRFIGAPIDYLVFKGIDNNNIEEIVFLEIKSGKSKLSKREKSLKEAVLDKKVSWREIYLDI